MITPYNLHRHELIGLPVRVADSSHSQLIGIEGRVVNETRNTLTIEVEGEEKMIPKENATFHFTLPDKTMVEIEGKILVARPEDRIKKRYKKI